MTKRQMAVRGVIVGLTTSGVIVGFHFIGVSIADSTPGSEFDGVLKYAVPTMVGMLWFLPAVLIATRKA